jgi:nucleoside-diphosphate-sugar epimerase
VRVLVTGLEGYVGSQLIHFLQAAVLEEVRPVDA